MTIKTRTQARAEAAAKAKEKEQTSSKEDSVRDLSAKLDEELKKDQDPFNFPSVQRSKSPLRPDLRRIVETVFVNDVHAAYKKLLEALRIGENRSNHGTLQKNLDDAEHNAHEAHRVWITAKSELERWEKENAVTWSAMWSSATESLQREKDNGARNKQITDKDVSMRAASLFPDEWSAQENERIHTKLAIDSLENLAKMWESRCRSLNAMLSKLRG